MSPSAGPSTPTQDEIFKGPNVDQIYFNGPQIQGRDVRASDPSDNNHLHVEYKR